MSKDYYHRNDDDRDFKAGPGKTVNWLVVDKVSKKFTIVKANSGVKAKFEAEKKIGMVSNGADYYFDLEFVE